MTITLCVKHVFDADYQFIAARLVKFSLLFFSRRLSTICGEIKMYYNNATRKGVCCNTLLVVDENGYKCIN